MTEPIYDQLTAEHARYHHNHHHTNHQEHPVNVLEDVKGFVTRMEQDAKNLVESHAGELDKLTRFAEQAGTDPLIATGLSLIGFTAPMRSAAAEFLAKVDGELQALATAHAQKVAALHDAGHAQSVCIAPDMHEAEPEQTAA